MIALLTSVIKRVVGLPDAKFQGIGRGAAPTVSNLAWVTSSVRQAFWKTTHLLHSHSSRGDVVGVLVRLVVGVVVGVVVPVLVGEDVLVVVGLVVCVVVGVEGIQRLEHSSITSSVHMQSSG